MCLKKAVLNGNKKQTFYNGATWAELYKILYDLLERRQQLLPYAREFSLIDDTLKNYFHGVQSCSIGEYKVTGRSQEGLKGGTQKWIVEIQKQNKN